MAQHTDLIGSSEACRILGIHRVTLTRWVKAGKVRIALRLPGDTGALLYNRADIKALANNDDTAAAS